MCEQRRDVMGTQDTRETAETGGPRRHGFNTPESWAPPGAPLEPLASQPRAHACDGGRGTGRMRTGFPLRTLSGGGEGSPSVNDAEQRTLVQNILINNAFTSLLPRRGSAAVPVTTTPPSCPLPLRRLGPPPAQPVSRCGSGAARLPGLWKRVPFSMWPSQAA